MHAIKLHFLVLSVAALGAQGCGTDVPGGMPGCDNLGTSGTAVQVERVLAAADTFESRSAAVSAELAAVCERMATDLGLTVMAEADQSDAEAACEAVAAEITAIRSGLEGSITVNAMPPRCYIDASASANCVAECDVDFDANADIQCEGGEVRGMCEGECTGQCYLEGDVTCAAECQGTCMGTCTGSCNGACDGTCSLEDAAGNCIGTCDGTCMGTCSAECTGTCSGTCVADVDAACMGTCEGSCSVAFMEPRCTGDADISADADCQAACDAEVRAEATCTRGSVEVVYDGLTSDSRGAVLVSTLQNNWGEFLAIAAKLEGVAEAGGVLVDSAGALAGNVADLGVQAGACLTVAVEGAVSAVAEVQVSVSVSVEVQGSVSAS